MGIKNQSEEMKRVLRSRITWANNGRTFITGPHESTVDLRKTLNSFVPREKPGDQSLFLLKGKQPVWCGWTILNIEEI